MASLRLIVVVIVLFVGIVTNVEARVQTRSQTAQNLAQSVEKPSKDGADTFETLTKLKGSSNSKKRTLLGENLEKVHDEDAEELSEEGSGDLIKEKVEDDEYYFDDEDDEDEEDYEDDEDIYDDEYEEFSGDEEYDDEDDYDDDDEKDYEEEEDYLNKESKKENKSTKIEELKAKDDKKDSKQATIHSTDDDLHFADDEETSKDLNLSEDEYKVKNQIKNGEILYEYYNEFFEDDDDDYEEELNDEVEVNDRRTFTNKPNRPSIKKETIPSRTIPSYFGNLSTSHILLMGASALISFILFTIAFVVCCHQKQQKKKFGNMPFVIDSKLLSNSSQKSHHPSNFVTNSSTSIVKNYQRVPTSTKEFLSSDSTSTSCSSGLENPNHLPELMEVGSGETKKPLLP